jgi:FkbM family methyltransferase
LNFVYDDIGIDIVLDERHDYLMKWSIENKTFREENLLRFLKDYNIITKESVVLDVGSYIGNHVIYFSKVIGAKKVIAFEPTLFSFNILEKNVEINTLKNVEINNLAVLSKSGFAKCNIRRENNPAKNQWHECNEKLTKSVSLSEFIKEKVDFIKIDVEGMELEVLSGGKELIKKYSPYLMVEVMKYNLQEFELLMKDLNYTRIGEDVFKLNREKKANTILYKSN